MNIIDLQNKTSPNEATIEYYWFENQFINLPKTRFHRITIPLKPFDSGLSYVEQPEETVLVIDWIKLNMDDPSSLSGVEISTEATEGVEASIYIGAAHNWTTIEQPELEEIDSNKYRLKAKLLVEFEHQGAGRNENFHFQTTAIFKGEA